VVRLLAVPGAALGSQLGEAASTARRSALHPITSQTADLPSHRGPPYSRHTQAHCRSTDSTLRPPPQSVLAITLDREPPALLSTRIIPRTAVRPGRRLAAGGATQQLAWQCSPQSRALAGGLTAEPSWLPSAACAAATAARFAVQRCRGTRMSGRPPRLGRPVRVHMSSVRPSSVRRPGRVQRPRVRCPVSARPVSDVQCPVPGVHVRCPVRASAIRVHSVRTGEFVEQVGATGSHTTRDTSVG
jgi:hypothetical protein